MDLKKLDELLFMLVDAIGFGVEKSIEDNTLTKDQIDSACVILSVAYERVRSLDK